jgi:hypothetical protein
MLPAVLHGCETWSLTLRDEQRLRMPESSVLKRIFGPNKDEITGGWIELCNGQLLNLYCSINIIRMISRRMRCTGHVAHRIKCLQIFGRKT